jgi:hypothetical protein
MSKSSRGAILAFTSIAGRAATETGRVAEAWLEMQSLMARLAKRDSVRVARSERLLARDLEERVTLSQEVDAAFEEMMYGNIRDAGVSDTVRDLTAPAPERVRVDAELRAMQAGWRAKTGGAF